MVRGSLQSLGVESGGRHWLWQRMKNSAIEYWPDSELLPESAMYNNDIQRAKAIHEEETEYYIGIDPGTYDGYCIFGIREGKVQEVHFSNFASGGKVYDWAKEPYDVFWRPPGRFRALYLAIRSSVRDWREAILRRGHRD